MLLNEELPTVCIA